MDTKYLVVTSKCPTSSLPSPTVLQPFPENVPSNDVAQEIEGTRVVHAPEDDGLLDTPATPVARPDEVDAEYYYSYSSVGQGDVNDHAGEEETGSGEEDAAPAATTRAQPLNGLAIQDGLAFKDGLEVEDEPSASVSLVTFILLIATTVFLLLVVGGAYWLWKKRRTGKLQAHPVRPFRVGVRQRRVSTERAVNDVERAVNEGPTLAVVSLSSEL